MVHIKNYNKLFKFRILLPWKGSRDADLEKESGVVGAIFVHISGFIGGAKTRNGVMHMAEDTLLQNNRWKKPDQAARP